MPAFARILCVSFSSYSGAIDCASVPIITTSLSADVYKRQVVTVCVFITVKGFLCQKLSQNSLLTCPDSLFQSNLFGTDVYKRQEYGCNSMRIYNGKRFPMSDDYRV